MKRPSIPLPIPLEKHELLAPFRENAEPYICYTLATLFGCKISVETDPASAFSRRWGIDINASPERRCYQQPESRGIVIRIGGRPAKAFTCLGIIFDDLHMYPDNATLEQVVIALSVALTDSSASGFLDAKSRLTERLIDDVIAWTFGKDRSGRLNIAYILTMFRRLGTATYEGQRFSTGLVITRSRDRYLERLSERRPHARLASMPSPIPLADPHLDKRFWYLVDGAQSHFFCDQSLIATDVVIRAAASAGLGSYLDAYTLSGVLRGRDIAFRILTNSDISVLTAAGGELIYSDLAWKYRNFTAILQEILSNGIGNNVAKSLLFYVLRCSQRRQSALAYVQTDDKAVLSDAFSHWLVSPDIQIHVSDTSSLVMRMLTSDGALVVSRQGSVLAYNGIVALTAPKNKVASGTGARAAEQLSRLGLVFKISQDGTVKMYRNERTILTF